VWDTGWDIHAIKAPGSSNVTIAIITLKLASYDYVNLCHRMVVYSLLFLSDWEGHQSNDSFFTDRRGSFVWIDVSRWPTYRVDEVADESRFLYPRYMPLGFQGGSRDNL
jgi:hypothetical protein